MQQDIRANQHFTDAQQLYQHLHRVGSGLICDAVNLSVAPDNSTAVFTGTLVDKLEGSPSTRICQVELNTGNVHLLTFGPGTDKAAVYAPCGRWIAFLSDRDTSLKPNSDFQLCLLNTNTGEAISAPRVDGWVESVNWSPDGTRILLGVAGHGADMAGGQGAVTSSQAADPTPAWMPVVKTREEECQWRTLWVYEVETQNLRQLPTPDYNVWEATWCGNQAIAAVTSPEPGEAAWYTATLDWIDAVSGAHRSLYQPQTQLGCPVANPTGSTLAVLESLCSDRGIVAGKLILIDTQTCIVECIATDEIDISCARWQSNTQLCVVGQRGFETVVGLIDTQKRAYTTTWADQVITGTGLYPLITPLWPSDHQYPAAGNCLMVSEGFYQAPEIVKIGADGYSSIVSFDYGYRELADKLINEAQAISWTAPDGLLIQGWLLLPRVLPTANSNNAPYPLVMNVHGGPVGLSKPRCLSRSPHNLLLLQQGYALFFPNPRGSTGRGQDFTQLVCGDMGGDDTQDLLSGLDWLTEQGIADPERLGVMGISYGGFMSAWLITQDSRFAASIPCSPCINWTSQHLMSNIPHFDGLFLNDDYKTALTSGANCQYLSRSPIYYADKVATPTLTIAGAQDRCTPPSEAMQFHQALLENDVISTLVVYPEEGHGITKLPTLFDFSARVVSWFKYHMPT